jgi:hypothetical protein
MTCERTLASALDDRAIGRGIAEGDTQLDGCGSAASHSQQKLVRSVEIGIAGGEIRHYSPAPCGAKIGKGLL